MKRKKVYVDQDMVLANFKKAYDEDLSITPSQFYPQSQFGFFLKLEEMPYAIRSFKFLEEFFDMYILTRPSIYNINCYSEKALWILNHLGFEELKNTIMCCDKSLLKGDYLIDDSNTDGQENFEGEWIQFGSSKYPDWNSVVNYLMRKEFNINI